MKFERVVVIGCGGTGSFLINPLCRYLLNHECEIILCDGDSYQPNNINRQNFNTKFMNTNKAEYQAMATISAMPSMESRISVIDRYLGKDDLPTLIKEKTLVINCADNISIRKYVEDHISTLNTAAHICCGNENIRGQVQLSFIMNDTRLTHTIYDKYPEFNQEKDDKSKMSCEQLSALPSGGQLICSNFMCAALALAYIHRLFSNKNLDGDSGIDFNLIINSFNIHFPRELNF